MLPQLLGRPAASASAGEGVGHGIGAEFLEEFIREPSALRPATAETGDRTPTEGTDLEENRGGMLQTKETYKNLLHYRSGA